MALGFLLGDLSHPVAATLTRGLYHFAVRTADTVTVTARRVEDDPAVLDRWTSLGVTDTNDVVDLQIVGFTPDTYAPWAALGLRPTVVEALHAAGGTPETVQPYLAHEYLAMVNPAELIGQSLSRRVPADAAAAFCTAGISEPANFCDLYDWGCTPDVAAGWLAKRFPGQPARLYQDTFTGVYEVLSGDQSLYDGPSGYGYDPDLINAVLRHGGDRSNIRAWRDTGLPAERVDAYIAAGISPAETKYPQIASATTTTLSVLAALRA